MRRYKTKKGYDSTYQELVGENKYTKNRYKVGQVIKSKENLINNLYKIDNVVDKGKYNMYIAKNIKFGWTLTITDKDDYEIVE